MNSTELEISDLRSKVRNLLDSGSYSNEEFVHWLEMYAKRGKEILHPIKNVKPRERDVRRELKSFQIDQKVIDWVHEKKITLTKGVYWWWLNPEERTGYIHGLDNSRGIPRITNGIDVWIERGDGSTFLGHRDWLRMDRRSRDLSKEGNGEVKKKKKLDPHSMSLAKALVENNTIDQFATRFAKLLGKTLSYKKGDIEGLAEQVEEYMNKSLLNI